MTIDSHSDSPYGTDEELLTLPQAATRLNLTVTEVNALIWASTLRSRIIQGERFVCLPKSISVTQPLPDSVMERMRKARITPEQLRTTAEPHSDPTDSDILPDAARTAGILTAVDAAILEHAAVEALKRRWRESERIPLSPDLIQSLTDGPRGNGETVHASVSSFRVEVEVPSIGRRDTPTNVMLRWILDVGELSRVLAPRRPKRALIIEAHIVSDVATHRARGYVDSAQEYDALGSLLDRIDEAASQDNVTVMILCATAGWSTAVRHIWTAERAPARERVILVLQDLQDGTISTHPGEPRAATFHEWLAMPFRQERIRRLADSLADAIIGRIGIVEDEWPSLTNDATADRSMIEEAVSMLVSTQKARLDELSGIGRVLRERRTTNPGSEEL